MLNVEKIREDFPLLNRKINGKPIIYFDNACMTLRPTQVIDAVNSYYKERPACGGRSLHRLGKEVTEAVTISRKTIQRFINARKVEEIIFTKNTTEAINLIAHSLDFKKGDVVLTTDKEHNSNLMPWQLLAKNKIIKHEIVKSNEDNTFNLERFEQILNKKDVRLVSMVHTSNLDGYTIPAQEIIKIAHEYDTLVLLDGAQSVPHKEIDVKRLDVDFLAFSGHKMLGPSGTGILYGKSHLLERLKPFLVGGETVINTTYTSFELEKPPERFEAGLQNYAGMIGLGVAADYLMKIGKKNINEHEAELNKIITRGLKEMDAEIIGPPDPELRGGIISFNIKGMDFHNVAMLLDETNSIMVRSGQHCVHSWFNAHNIKGSVRVSLYLYNTEEECKIFVDALRKIAELGK